MWILRISYYEQVLQLIEEQIQKVDQRIDALLLVGGFAGSEYLKERIEVGLTIKIVLGFSQVEHRNASRLEFE